MFMMVHKKMVVSYGKWEDIEDSSVYGKWEDIEDSSV